MLENKINVKISTSKNWACLEKLYTAGVIKRYIIKRAEEKKYKREPFNPRYHYTLTHQ